MEAPPLVARHRFLMGDSVKVDIEGKTYRGIVIGISAPKIELSKINPYGIPAHRINVYHSDTYTVIFYGPRPYQFNQDQNIQPYSVNQDENTQPYQANRDENKQTGATSHEANNGPVTNHESSNGIMISYATNPGQFDADRNHFAALMPPGVDLYNINAYIAPYTVILYGMIPGNVDTYVNNPYPMAYFGISPNSINADDVYLDADVPFGTEPHRGAYGLLPRDATIPSYMIDIQHRVKFFRSNDEYGEPMSWEEWEGTDLGVTIFFEDRLRRDDEHPDVQPVSNPDEQGPHMCLCHTNSVEEYGTV